MSILSSERFYGNNLCIDISEDTNFVEVSFFPAITGNSTATSSTATRVYMNGNQDHFVLANNNFTINNGTGYVSSTSASMYTLVGFKLYFRDSILRCLKKEMPHSGIVASTNFIEATQYIKESPCHLHELTQSIRDQQMMHHIQGKILNLANRYGVFIPDEFKPIDEQYNGVQREMVSPALDWLCYPLVRELRSVAFAKNLLPQDRKLIAPDCEALDFKGLVSHHYGHVTGKMLEEIWKVLTTGEDRDETNYATMAPIANIYDPNALPEMAPVTYTRQVGTRALQNLVFTLCPAVFKAMGFDYLYQLLPQIDHGPAPAGATRTRTGLSYDNPSSLEIAIKGLMQILSPKKLITLLLELTDPGNFHYLQDTLRMIGEYCTLEKIPLTLRGQFPTGLTMDFKFKNLKEMHDKISTQYTIIKTEADKKEIPVHPLYDLLDGREEKGLRLVVPRTTTPLAVWGKLLNICIASYGDRAARGDTLLLGVEKEGLIKYCIEFSHAKIPKEGEKVTQAPGAIIGFNQTMFDTTKTDLPPLPRMAMKHCGVMPPDVPEEEGLYCDPQIIQFRSERNGSPDPADRQVVENLLHQWTHENLKALENIPALFKSDGTYSYEVRMGQPDQIIMAPAQYEAYQRLLGPQEIVDPGPPPEPPINHINLIPNVNVNPDQVLVVDGTNAVTITIPNMRADIENNFVDGPD